ncbi:MAG: hypothetical protein HRU69_03905 [Flammeovirgaceae bacterium]|nr:MAG: hypothetical protein HRU69_03905 [Flammeovirgaceae bacterium]
MKVGPQSYRGIEFVCLDDLPSSQQMLLSSSPDFPERIKILIDNKTVENCIQYKDYEQWFYAVYKRSVAPPESLNRQTAKSMGVKLAFDKA